MSVSPNLNTAFYVIDRAMHDAGLLQQGDEPTGEQYAVNMGRLNDIINFRQTQGLKLWLQYDLPVPLVAGQAAYTIGVSGSVNITKPTRILDSNYYLDQSANRRPISLISRDDYMRLSTTTQLGAISSVFVDKQQLFLIANFWLTPDTTAATGVAHVLIQNQVTNFVGLTDTMNFPVEWMMALRWGLAEDICTGQPQAIMDRCTKFSEVYWKALEDWDVEDAKTNFAVDMQQTSHYGRFR